MVIVKMLQKVFQSVRWQQLKHNGPAIWGGCVTRRSIRAGSWYFSRETVTVQGGYGALFAVTVQILLRAGAIAVQVWSSREFIPGYKFGDVHWRSVAVQAVSEPEICPGAGFQLRTDERVRVQEPLRICLECRSKSKKCDKQLTHIVRVSVSDLFFCLG